MNKRIRTSLQALLKGDFHAWTGLAAGTTIDLFYPDLYLSEPGGKSGRLSGNWLTYYDFSATEELFPARVWTDEGRVVRIDLDALALNDDAEQLRRLGAPEKTRLPPQGLRFIGEDELREYLYLERGLVLHVTDPVLPGGSGREHILRARACEPMSEAEYDQKLGGQQPGKFRRPNWI